MYLTSQVLSIDTNGERNGKLFKFENFNYQIHKIFKSSAATVLPNYNL